MTVREVAWDRADLEVAVEHPNAGPVPEDLGFAFTLLCDAIVDFRGCIDGGPLAREVGLTESCDERFVADNAGGFVASSRIVEEHDHPPPPAQDQVFWASSRASMAVLRVVPTHPAWIVHLQPRQRWSTTSYARQGVVAWERPRWPGDRLIVPAEDPLEGMRVEAVQARLERLERYLRDIPGDTIVIPRFGSLHYEAAERLAGDAVTPEALRRWLGRPVLVERHDGGRAVGTLLASDPGRFHLYEEGPWGDRIHSEPYADCRAAGRARYLRRYDVTAPMPPEIEAQLREDPNDTATWLVLADRLTDRGDPLGPLLYARYGGHS